MKYKKRIVISIFLMLLLPVILNTIVVFASMIGREERLKGELIAGTSAQLQSTMDYFIKRIQTDLVYLSSRPELQNLRWWYENSDFREKRNFYRNLDPFNRLAEFYDDAYLVHPDDDLMLDMKNKFVTPIGESAAESTIKLLNETLESYVGEKDLLISIPVGDESAVFLIRNIRNSISGRDFYIYIRLNEYFFKSLLDEIFMIDGSFVVIANQDEDAVVMRRKNLTLDIEALPPMRELLLPEPEVVELPDGSRHLVAGTRSPDTGWLYIYGLDYSEVRSRLLEYLLRTGFITMAVVAVFAVLSQWLANALYAPVRSLMASLEGADSGTDIDEFSRVQRHIRSLAERNRALDQSLARNLPYRKEGVIQTLLTGSAASDPEAVPDAERIGPELAPQPGDRFLIIEALLRNVLDGPGTARRDFYVVSRDETIAQWFHFHPGIRYETVLMEESTLVFICRIPANLLSPENPAGDADTLGVADILTIDEEIRDLVYLGYSTLQDSLAGLSRAYKEARIAVEYRTLFPGASLIGYAGVMAGRSRLHFYPFGEENKLINAVKQRDEEAARDHLGQFFSILSTAGLSFNQLKYAAFHLMDSYLRVLRDFDLPLDESTARRISESSDLLEEAIDPDEIRKRMEEIMEAILAVMEANQSSSSLLIAEKVRDFVDARYTDRNISLDQIADEVNYSVSHISAIFKTSYGETIKQYITNTRLAKARELLIGTDTKIESIGKETGYDNVGSFVKIFKAYTGETPKSYRLRNRDT